MCMELTQAGSRLWALGFWKGLKPTVQSHKPICASSEFLMVKLLRAYGECLGARSR